jgi:hypothetical protein
MPVAGPALSLAGIALGSPSPSPPPQACRASEAATSAMKEQAAGFRPRAAKRKRRFGQ